MVVVSSAMAGDCAADPEQDGLVDRRVSVIKLLTGLRRAGLSPAAIGAVATAEGRRGQVMREHSRRAPPK
jgi:hypothetical protein